MTSGPIEPDDALLGAADRAMMPWLERLVVTVTGVEPGDTTATDGPALAAAIDSIGSNALAELGRLLSDDVDRQTTTPLAVFRDATAALTEVLVGLGYPPTVRDRFHIDRFPDDVYHLVPASWADIDDSLTEPAIVWGAWKASTILGRRRSADGER